MNRADRLDGRSTDCYERVYEEAPAYQDRFNRFEAFMSPRSVAEKLYFFVAEYEAAKKHSAEGGIAVKGEDSDV